MPSPLVPALVRHVHARSGRAGALIARFQLPEDVESLDEATLAPSAFGELLEAAARELEDPALGVHLPEVLPLRRYGMAELAARASPTLKESLERLARYGPLLGAPHAFALETEPGEARFTHRLPGYPRGLGRHAHEYLLAWTLALAREHTGLPLPVQRVWFLHPRPRDVKPLEAFFGTAELDFGHTGNGMALDPALLDTPLRTADARLLATAEHLAERALKELPRETDFVGQVTARVREALAAGDAGARTVAQALRMSARTLQRRLEDAGTSFSEVVDGVRADQGRRLVAEGTLPLAEIAYRLGFSDVGTFSRAFKRWTGSAPGAYRTTSR